MRTHLLLTKQGRSPGSYMRQNYKNDVLYYSYRYRQISLVFAKQPGSALRVTDSLSQQMLQDGLITDAQIAAYESRVSQVFGRPEDWDDSSIEDIYLQLHNLRKELFGIASLEQAQTYAMRRGVPFDPQGGIDQRRKKTELLDTHPTVILVLHEAELFSLMQADLQEARQRRKEIYLLVSRQRGNDLLSRQLMQQWLPDSIGIHFLETDTDHHGNIFEGISWDPQLQSRIDRGECCLFAYGEEGLLQCRKLLTDAVVSCIPVGYHAQAVTNQLGCTRACTVFIPKGFDITRWVPITDKTRLSYWQLAKLWQAHGDSIYSCSIPELYEKYPQYFLNIYENGPVCREAAPDYPIRLASGPMEDFEALRDQKIEQYLNNFENIQYFPAYFDEALEQKPLCRDNWQKQGGILVHGIRVKKARQARVMACGKGNTLRQLFEKEPPEPGIVSNFLFFLTDKLAALYNALRSDRPREQATIFAGHLDYMLQRKGGKRIETFPLFRKTCIAMKENGEFLFFNFRLGGGRLWAGEFPLCWKSEDVDVPQGAALGPVAIYTPYYSLPDADADRQTYRKSVGQDRINLVILQDRICCVRKGDVLLPGIGVVVSLEEAAAQALLEKLPPLENGYYDPSALELRVELDAPSQLPTEQWQQVCWAYGGGLSLILDGVGLCDGDHMDQWFEEEGWKSPLSRQTQESTLHQLVKHPRTAIGITENGELVVLVYSGRTWRSTGADYREMIHIARQLFPDIRCLMNADGGGSAVLGLVTGGSFMELSCPSTSTGSCVGMARPVNTVLYIPLGKEK